MNLMLILDDPGTTNVTISDVSQEEDDRITKAVVSGDYTWLDVTPDFGTRVSLKVDRVVVIIRVDTS